MNEDIFRNMIKTALLAQLQMNSSDLRKIGPWMFGGSNEHRNYLECHPSIKSNLTDQDMLLLQIDMALDKGDAEGFMQLTNALKRMEVLI